MLALADCAVSFSSVSQYLDRVTQYIGFTLFTMFLYGLVLSMGTIVVYGIGIVTARHALPARSLVSWWKEHRDHALLSSHVLAFVLMLAASLVALQQLSLVVIREFNHDGLIAALIAVFAVVLPCVAMVAAMFLARAFARPLSALASLDRRWLTLLVCWGVPAAVTVGMVVALAVSQWDTVRALPVRAMCVGSAAGLLAVVAASVGARGRVFKGVPGPAGALSAPVTWVLLLVLLHAIGLSEPVRKAVDAYTGIGRYVMSGLQGAIDLDGDGYSPLFGGGDCNDLDEDVHRGAMDWPGNGIDENCVGGDAVVAGRSVSRFHDIPSSVPDRLNVLLITIDAMRADHLGCYGYGRDTSPNIDALAEAGVLFEKGYSHAPSTRYAFPSLLTSRYPASVLWGDGTWPPPVLPGNLTWAEKMKEHGLYTAAILNYRFFKREWGLDQGFDLYDNSRSRLHTGRSDPATHGTSSGQMADAAVAFLKSHRSTRFFLWVHFYDPHWYYESHKGFKRFGDGRQDDYDHEVLFTDHHIGRVLSYLEESGLDEDTVVVLTGDHGEGFGEHGIDFHGYHLYNAQTSVPIIIKAPGIGPRRVSSQPVGHVDLLPTVVNLLGGEPEPAFQGLSTVDLMLHGNGEPRQVFQEVWYSDKGPFTSMKSIVTSRFKLIYTVQPTGTFELYDLISDRHESTDLWGRLDPDTERTLKEALIRHIEEDHFPVDFRERVAVNISDEPFADVPNPCEVLFGDPPVAKIVGYSIDPTRVNPGGMTDISVYWEVLGEVGDGLKLFAHLKTPSGKFTNLDHKPVAGLYPVSMWRPGQHIRDIQSVVIPKKYAGKKLRVLTGLYNAEGRMKTATSLPTGRKGGVYLDGVSVSRTYGR